MTIEQRDQQQRRRQGGHAPRGHALIQAMGTVWSYLDMTALGRQEAWESSPEGYPQSRPYKRWNWHDCYAANAPPDPKWVEVSDGGEAVFRTFRTYFINWRGDEGVIFFGDGRELRLAEDLADFGIPTGLIAGRADLRDRPNLVVLRAPAGASGLAAAIQQAIPAQLIAGALADARRTTGMRLPLSAIGYQARLGS